MLGRLVWALAVAAAGAFLGLPSSIATQTIGPARPLSRQESIEQAVSHADGVVIGYIEAYNSIRTSQPGGFESEDAYLVVRPKRWLKGASSEPLIRVMVGHANELTQSEYDPREPYYIFFRKRVDRDTGRSEWRINSSFGPVVRGMGKMTGNLEHLPDEVATAIGSQSITSMSRRADLIVLGQSLRQGLECHPYGQRWRCLRVQVISDLAGTAPDDTICVFSWTPGYEPNGQAIIFGRRMTDGSYEVLSGSAGGLEIANGIVRRTGLTVERQVAEIRALRKRKAD